MSLEVININVFYKNLHILFDVNLEIKKRETVAIIGPNGAGKTTLLRTISGILKPTSGLIKYCGERIDTLPPHEIALRGIAHVPEGKRILYSMSVYDNLLLGAYIKRAREKVNDTLEWVYQIFPILKERRKQRAGTLSGGEQQMLAIARALMSKPQLLLLDEPTLGLAPSIVLQIFKILNTLQEEGLTLLLVEQNVHKALQIADGVYILSSGSISPRYNAKELLGNKEEILESFLGVKLH